MVKRTIERTGSTAKVTFALPLDVAPTPTSVVGDFNGWDPHAHPLRKRSNGTRSVSVVLPVGETYRFKYLAEGDVWFCDPDADGSETGHDGVTNSLVIL